MLFYMVPGRIDITAAERATVFSHSLLEFRTSPTNSSASSRTLIRPEVEARDAGLHWCLAYRIDPVSLLPPGPDDLAGRAVAYLLETPIKP